MKTFDLKSDMPTKDVAVLRLRNFLKYSKTEKAVKVIHGYGSHGVGGGIRAAVRDELQALMAEGSIKAYIPGEALGVPMGFADAIQQYRHLVANDPDFRKSNDGITFVIL